MEYLHLRAGSVAAGACFELMLASNAIPALRELRIADTVLAAGVTIDSVGVNAGRIRRFDLQPVPVALRPVIASRQALHDTLLEAVGLDSITFGAEAVGFHDSGESVVLELLDGRTFSGEILLGADGVGSVIRRSLCPNAALRASGLVGLRGVALGVDALLDVDLAITLIRGADSAIMRGRDGAVYWFVSARGQLDASEVLDQERLDTGCPAAGSWSRNSDSDSRRHCVHDVPLHADAAIVRKHLREVFPRLKVCSDLPLVCIHSRDKSDVESLNAQDEPIRLSPHGAYHTVREAVRQRDLEALVVQRERVQHRIPTTLVQNLGKPMRGRQAGEDEVPRERPNPRPNLSLLIGAGVELREQINASHDDHHGCEQPVPLLL
jgi:hypothetical protein